VLSTISDWTYTRKPSVIASRRQPARSRKKARWLPSVLCCAVGLKSTATMAWCYGGNDLQRLDLRHTQAICGTAGDGPSSEDESHCCGQEEERCHRCSHHCRSGTVQLIARLLCVPAGSAGSAPTDALPPHDGSAVSEDAQQDAGLLMPRLSP
jgi:hypothetical protein